MRATLVESRPGEGEDVGGYRRVVTGALVFSAVSVLSCEREASSVVHDGSSRLAVCVLSCRVALAGYQIILLRQTTCVSEPETTRPSEYYDGAHDARGYTLRGITG